jgi:hypothetical protein
MSKQEIEVARKVYGGFFVAKALARFLFAALVLAAAAAQAQPQQQPRPDRAVHHGNQGNDFNWLAGGGGA